MRIAVVHSYYSSRQPSGENIAVDAQVELLLAAGHEVAVVAQRTDEMERRSGYPLKAAWTVATGHGPSPVPEIRRFRPDVVHVHNLFPNWGTQWLTEWDGPLVATLHNFRPVCAAATLSREGAQCTLCPDGARSAGVRHACFHDSRIKTLPLSWRNRGGATADAVLRRADRLVLLSTRARDLYAAFGVPPERMTLIPNALVDPGGHDTGVAERQDWLFAGRLSQEKGIDRLLAHWPNDEPLRIAGDGALRPWVEGHLPHRASLLGSVDRARVISHLRTCLGLLVPSVCPESATPLSAVEAFASGVPVVARAGSAAADAVDASGAGTVVSGDDWAGALDAVRREWAEMSKRARAFYQAEHTPARCAERLGALYSELA